MATPFEERAEAELRRGVLQLAVLAILRRRTYGYELLRVLEEAGLPTEEGTLYPILRRLQSDDLLSSEWDTTGSRPRKYYRTTDTGSAVLAALAADWARVNDALWRVLAVSGGDDEPEDGRQPGAAGVPG